jgi:hypothetical protein
MGKDSKILSIGINLPKSTARVDDFYDVPIKIEKDQQW